VRWTYDRLPEERKDKPFYRKKRFGVSKYITEVAKVALSVYVVDVFSIVLTTIGFQFPNKMHLTEVYAKCAYSIYALKQLLVFKTVALCRFF
jgi:hypothetical protein